MYCFTIATLAEIAQATPEAMSLPLAMVQAALSAALSVGLYQLRAWQKKADGLESRLGESTEKLVDQRLDAAAAAIESLAKANATALEDIRRRIGECEALLRTLADRTREIELALAGH